MAEGANPLSPEAQKNLAAHYGLDKPLPEQFVVFLSNAIRGDFGNSFVYKTRSVAEILRETFPISCSWQHGVVIAIAGGLTLGVLAAVYQNRMWDYLRSASPRSEWPCRISCWPSSSSSCSRS